MTVEMKKTILIVEDKPDVADLIAKFIKLGDFDTITCNNAKKAMKTLEESYDKIALILLDMSGRSGDSVLMYVINNEKYKDILVLLFSLKSYTEHVDRGCFSFPSPRKPFSGKELLDRIKTILSGEEVERGVEKICNLSKIRTLNTHNVYIYY